MEEVLIVLTNCPDPESARRISLHLLEQRLAACVNQMAPVQSSFRWNDAVESAVEVPLLIKCTRATYPLVEQAVRQLHPYDVPEIVALPLAAGYAPYLRWVADESRASRFA
jgi:periplasmic divalent cation tolerance protein